MQLPVQHKASRTSQVVIFGLLLMSFSWLADALIGAGFDAALLPRALFAPPPRELSLRLFCLLIEALFLGYILILFRRRAALEQELHTALQQTAAERARSEAILEAMGDGVSIQDRDLRILYQNAAHRSSMGDHRGEFCYAAYQKRTEICPGCHLALSFADGQVHRRETATEHSVKGHLDVEVVSTPLFDGNGHVFAGIEAVRDITERKRAEATIRSIQADLELRTRELSAANAELEAFGSTLAHDVRSLLSRIATAAEVLGRLGEGQLCPDGHFCIEAISAASTEMEDLVESILILSRISHREMDWQEVDLSTLAETVAVALAASEPQRRIEWRIQPGLKVKGDDGLLRIVLENLLGNAWKYTRDAELACIELDAIAEERGRIFRVHDNGVGFDMAEADKLFQPFARLSSSGTFAGNGIGLTTVRRIILRHQGSVRAESAPGQGATFSFFLPE